MYIALTLISILMLFGFIFGVMIMMLVFFAYVFGISIMLWMLVDAAKQDKFFWVMIIVALPVIGAIVYFFVEKEHEYAKIPKEKSHHKKEDAKEETIKLAEGEKKE